MRPGDQEGVVLPIALALAGLLVEAPVSALPDLSALRRAARDPSTEPAAQDACRLAWASAVVAADEDPEGLLPAERRALEAARRGGGFRVLGTIAGDELRMGVVDPLGVAGRIEAVLTTTTGRRIPLRGLGPKRALPSVGAGEVVVLARARDCLPGAILARARFPLRLDRLSVPEPPNPTSRPAIVGESPSELLAPRPAPFAWWWYVLLGTTALGVGLAAAEEL